LLAELRDFVCGTTEIETET